MFGGSKRSAGASRGAVAEVEPGVSEPAPPTAPAKKPVKPQDSLELRMARNFSHAVAVLMRDQNFRKMPLGELEWLVLPPLMAGQFRLGQLPQKTSATSEGGMMVPVALALWARVSPEIDKMLSEKLDEPIRLAPNQWASGDRLWLIALAGDPRAMPPFLRQLGETAFKDKVVKQRKRAANGEVVVAMLGEGA
jgi:cytolysin-activating lysine-acyltransferase